jgi:hypothetical protein
MLALVALMLGPLAMHRADAAPSAPELHAASADGHCGSEGQAPDDRDKGKGADCALACSAMPGAGAALEAAPLPSPSYSPARPSFFAGTAPGSDPPPPRLS